MNEREGDGICRAYEGCEREAVVEMYRRPLCAEHFGRVVNVMREMEGRVPPRGTVGDAGRRVRNLRIDLSKGWKRVFATLSRWR